MRKFMLFLFLSILILIPTSYAEVDIPVRFLSILQDWNAQTPEELQLNIIEYWRIINSDNPPNHYDTTHFPLKIRFGGTTQELIADRKKWDLAIVSSKDVDLQALLDKNLIEVYPHYPFFLPDLYQWLLPAEVQKIYPQDPNQTCYAFVYDYDAANDDATLLICKPNSATSNPPQPSSFAEEIMWKRSADTARALQGIHLIPQSAAWTEEDFLSKADAWDVGLLTLKQGETPDMLAQDGLLYDFSQIQYFASRSSVKPTDISVELAKGIFSADGRMIGIPCVRVDSDGDEADTVTMLIINNKSSYIERALTYAVHFMKSTEYYWHYLTDPENLPADISKDNMDW